MDLYNNEIGLKLAKENKFVVTHGKFIRLTKEAVRDGRCKIISGSKLVKSNSNGEK